MHGLFIIFLSTVLLADMPVPPLPLKIRAEVYREDGPALRLVSKTATGHSALTPDGRYLIYIDSGGLFVMSTKGGPPRKIGAAAPYFRFTPDAKYVLVPGSAWRRLSLGSQDGPIDVAPKERRHQLCGSAFSDTHVAFITAEGPMAVASILEGTSIRLPVEPPVDRRCHAGAGYPRAFSPDGQWLLFQHGCYDNELIRVDGTQRRHIGLVSAMFVDDLVVGNVEDKNGRIVFDRVEVVSLSDKKKRWKVKGTLLGSQPRRVPGKRAILQRDSEYRLVLIDLEKMKMRVLHQGDERVTNSAEVTPDGKRGLYTTQHQKVGCAVHQVDLESGKRQRLALVEGASQCFIKPLGNKRAVMYAWGKGAIMATIDLKTAVVRRLDVPPNSIGNLNTAGKSVTLNANGRLYLGRP
jgi:hypothetical protein